MLFVVVGRVARERTLRWAQLVMIQECGQPLTLGIPCVPAFTEDPVRCKLPRSLSSLLDNYVFSPHPKSPVHTDGTKQKRLLVPRTSPTVSAPAQQLLGNVRVNIDILPDLRGD